MSIQSEINRIKAAVASAYEAAKSKGAVAPELEDVANLASTILTITGGGGDIPLGNKLYTFGVLSDIHLRPSNGYNCIDDFKRAIQKMQDLGVEFFGIAGDLGYNDTVDELQLYQTILSECAGVPCHCVRGNHDVKQTEDNWLAYTGFASNHEFIYCGDVFLFLSMDVSNNSSSNHDTPYASGMGWLKDRLERYKGARIFIFCHYPPSGYSGLADGQYYGWSKASTEDDELVTTINQTKNVVMFTGHTHYTFQAEETYDNINIYRFNSSKTALVHVPSCCYPKNANSEIVEDLSQGYLVEVYEQGIVLRGLDLVTGLLMPEYEYVLSSDNFPSAVENAIILSSNNISLAAGSSTQVEVIIASPADVEVYISVNNSNVTVSPASMVFTKENYNMPQPITIVAASNVEINATSVITLRADGLTSKTVSVVLDEIPLTDISGGTNTIVDGGAYGGTYTDTRLELRTAAEFTITFVGFDLTDNKTCVYLSSSGIKGTINVGGVNTIHSTGSRGISSSATVPVKLIGFGSGPSLSVIGDSSSSAALKGDYEITGLDFAVRSAKIPLDVVNSGVTIVGDGSYSVNTAKVQVLACDHGILSVNVGAGTPGSSAITVTATPEDGYVLSAILVNGVASTDSLTMPAAGETMTIQGVFAAA